MLGLGLVCIQKNTSLLIKAVKLPSLRDNTEVIKTKKKKLENKMKGGGGIMHAVCDLGTFRVRTKWFGVKSLVLHSLKTNY